jgi:glycerol kinase
MKGMLGLGIYSSVDQFSKLNRKSKNFRPQMKTCDAQKLHEGWLAAVKRVL